MAILDKKTLTGFFGIPAGTKLYNWLNPCCDEFCNDVNACIGVKFYTTTVLLTPQQLLNSFTNPIVLIPAPPAGQQIHVVSGQIFYTFGTTAYNTSGTGLFQGGEYLDDGSIGSILSNFPNQGLKLGLGYDPASGTLYNSAVTVYSPGANPTGGDGTLSISLVYTITD